MTDEPLFLPASSASPMKTKSKSTRGGERVVDAVDDSQIDLDGRNKGSSKNSDPIGDMDEEPIEEIEEIEVEQDDDLETQVTSRKDGMVTPEKGLMARNGLASEITKYGANRSSLTPRAYKPETAEAGPSRLRTPISNTGRRSRSVQDPVNSVRGRKSTTHSVDLDDGGNMEDLIIASPTPEPVSSSRKRTRLVVSITSLPPHELRKYIPFPGTTTVLRNGNTESNEISTSSSRSVSIVPFPSEGKIDGSNRKERSNGIRPLRGGRPKNEARRKRDKGDDSYSSVDLGGFGTEGEGEDEEGEEEGSSVDGSEGDNESLDGIRIRRSRRSNGKGKEKEGTKTGPRWAVARATMSETPPHVRLTRQMNKSIPPPKRRRLSTDPASESDYDDRKRKLGKAKIGGGNDERDDEDADSPSWDEEEGEDEMDELGDWDELADESDESWNGKGKKKGRRKGGKANEVEEDDEEVLGRHREACEKCTRGPADEILQTALARKKKGTKSKRKEDDDLISDEELAFQLEGWLECKRCVISSHWGCLAPQQRKDVLVSLLEKEGPPPTGKKPRRSIAVDEVSDFVCTRCSNYNRCFVCRDEWIREPSSSKGLNREPENNAGGTADKAIEIDGDEHVHSSTDVNGVPETATGFAAKDSDTRGKSPRKVVENGYSTAEEAEAGKEHGTERMDIDDPIPEPVEKQAPLLFRCLRCRQAVHYEHLTNPFPKSESLAKIAKYYQTDPEKLKQAWFCHQCRAWKNAVDVIIAWRPYPAGAVEPPHESGEKPHYKDALPREYLVKWQEKGFRHVTWVPHPWLLATTHQKLKHFLEKGPKLEFVTDETLAARGDDIAEPTIARVMEEDDQVQGRGGRGHHRHEVDPQKDPEIGLDVNAESSIPIEWSTADRILDVMLRPQQLAAAFKAKLKGKTVRRGARIMSESGSEEPEVLDSQNNGKVADFADGVQPPASEQVEISAWEMRFGKDLGEEDVDLVAPLVSWCLIKWDDLQYDQSTWDTPPPVKSPLYPAFKHALRRYLGARRVEVPVLTAAQVRARELEAARLARSWVPPETQPECIVGGQLMAFQMQGLQWLLAKHFRRESCILADDMGLGKTIQIASVLGYLGSKTIYPSLVIVPNSTITNWVREFEKWVPHVRVVPYYGESASRKIISKYELYHKGQQNKATGLKAHVILTTYDMITGGEFSVFSRIPRWEILCIDEGQRLKSDGSLIFNRLKQLNSVHRILMTGTPLNNNLRELFNLLNFLDEPNFQNPEDLQNQFENLNEVKVTQLHEIIKPYILRRIKADVLKLPPMVEIIVPISLAPGIQKTVYKQILERNLKFLGDIAAKKAKIKKKAIVAPPAEASAANGGVDPLAAAEAPSEVMDTHKSTAAENLRQLADTTDVPDEPKEVEIPAVGAEQNGPSEAVTADPNEPREIVMAAPEHGPEEPVAADVPNGTGL